MQVIIEKPGEKDLAEAERICRLAFGTFLGQSDPNRVMQGYNYIRSRWKTNPEAVFLAKVENRIIGSNMATHWGSFSFFGPLTVDPEFWDKQVGSLLMQPIVGCFDRWQSRLQGLFTFPSSSKHVGLYQKFGFWPRFLTKLVARPVAPGTAEPGILFSKLSKTLEQEALEGCRELSDRLFEGLDLSREILSLEEQGLGETVLIEDNQSLSGFAICQCGAGTEAGPENCYVKFATVRQVPTPETHMLRLLSAIEDLAHSRKLARISAGVNMGRERIAILMAELGFKTVLQGLAMHRPNDPGFSRRDSFVLDDWR